MMLSNLTGVNIRVCGWGGVGGNTPETDKFQGHGVHWGGGRVWASRGAVIHMQYRRSLCITPIPPRIPMRAGWVGWGGGGGVGALWGELMK